MPVSISTWNRAGRPRSAAADSRRRTEVADGRIDVVRERPLDLGGQGAATTRRSATGNPRSELEPLVKRRDAEVRHPFGLRGVRHLDRAVPVGVGFGHQKQSRPVPDERPERSQVRR